MNNSVVSVCMITYNHEKYIKESIEGVLIQIVDFDIELIISNDCSADGTDKIIREIIANKSVRIQIKYFDHEKNLGMMPNFIFALKQCKGNYIALCEGDDYWTDPLKLQKQVDFLEKNPDYNICFHRANMLKNGCQLELHPIPAISCNRDYLYKDLLEHYNFILTASVVFKKPENFIIPKWFTKLPFGDFGLYLLVSDNKKIKCLEDKMSVYRIHDRGVWSGLNQRAGKILYLQFYKNIYNALDSAEKKVVRRKAGKLTREIAKSEFNNSRLKQLGYYFYLKLNTIKLWSLN